MRFEGLKLYDKQKQIADSIIQSDKMYHCICASRQCGKSVLALQLLLYFAINNPNWQCCYCTMTYSQSQKVFKTLLAGIKNWNIIAKTNRIENSIILNNGSEIYFKSYQRADTIRGYSFNVVLLDEAAFMDDADYYEALRPTLAAAGKKCILCSSPRGSNFFYDIYQSGLKNEPNYASYFLSYTDSPYINLDEIEDARKKLPDKIFRAEYLGEFIDGAQSVFDNYRNCVNIAAADGKCFAAIDVGRQNDYTVLTIMRGRKVVFMNRWNNTTWEVITAEICKVLGQYKPVQTYVEVNGIGDVFFEMLMKALRSTQCQTELKPWTTTNVSKANIIEKLIADFASKNISIPNWPPLLDELGWFGAEYSKKNHSIVYAARNGKNDDTVMSLAICNWHSNHSQNSGVYVFDFI